jgi:hypothetical protein
VKWPVALAAVTLALAATASPARPADPEPPPAKVREIGVEFALSGRAQWDAPFRVRSKKELAGMLPKETAEAIARGVDFRREHLLLFWWTGSGGDRLAATRKGEVVTFTITFGESNESVRQSRAYVIPARAKVAFAVE